MDPRRRRRGRLELFASLIVMPLTAVFLLWGGWILSAKRIATKELLPFGLTAAILTTVDSVGAAVYVPHLFSSYATRYGVICAVFAMISTLFCVFLIVVASAAVGREVSDELGRIRRGEHPPDDDVRRQWENVLGEARSKWRVARQRIDRSHRREEPRQR
jgi:uncharacterized BrkB/YihY/UPF0761 family membrane protein